MKINDDTYDVITSKDITNIEKAVDKSTLTMPLRVPPANYIKCKSLLKSFYTVFMYSTMPRYM